MQQRHARAALFFFAALVAYGSEAAADNTSEYPGCLANPRQTSIFQKILTAIRYSGNKPLKLMEKGWPSHKLNAAIARILLTEVLGHSVEIDTSLAATDGSYARLADDLADLDFEMWSTSARTDYAKHKSVVKNAGDTYDYGRSGLYIRASDQDGEAELIKRFGRTYSYFNTTLLPLLPTVSEAIAAGDCPDSREQHCVEMPNRACHDMECRALLKDFSANDPGIIEEMIRNASLPLAIVYTNGNEPAIFARNTSRTLLFYKWEPHVLLPPGNSFMRLSFEDPNVCKQNGSTTAFPDNRACDFGVGGIHKAFSPRVSTNYPDVAYFAHSFKIRASDILAMQLRLQNEYPGVTGSAMSHAIDKIACDWVQANSLIWERKWLIEPPIAEAWKHWAPLMTTIAGLILVLLWLAIPCVTKDPAVGHQWDGAALALKTPLSSILLPCARACIQASCTVLSVATYAKLARAIVRSCGFNRVLPRSLDGATSSSGKLGERSSAIGLIGPTRSMNIRRSNTSLIGAVPRGHLAQLAERSTGGDPDTLGTEGSQLTAEARLAKENQLLMENRMNTPAAAFIQTFMRSGSLTMSMASRLRASRAVVEGVQFVQRRTWAIEGDGDFRVGIMRGVTLMHEPIVLRVAARSGTAKEGRDFVIREPRVEMSANERYVTVNIDILNNGVSFSGGSDSSWLPVRDFVLTLSVEHQSQHTQLGSTQTCLVHVIDDDDWPSNAAITKGQSSVYYEYAMQIFRSNWYQESWAFAGLLLGAIIGSVIKPLLTSTMLIDIAIAHDSLDWSMLIAGIYCLCELIEHITSLWFSSSWSVGYDLPLDWILAKWSYLPLHQVLDHKVRLKYRAMIELITDHFFGQHDYSLFVQMQHTIIKACVLLFWAPIQPSLIGGREGLSFNFQITRIVIMPFVYLVTAGIWVLAVHMSTNKYIPAVEAWMSKDAQFIERIYMQFENSVLQRSFRATTVEYERTKRKMKTMRDKAFTMYAVKAAARKKFDWLVVIVYVLFLAASPIFKVYGFFTPGTLLGALYSLMQAKGILQDATEVLDGLAVSQLLLSQFATLLNDSRHLMVRQVTHSNTALAFVRNRLKDPSTLYRDRQRIKYNIELFRLRYTATDMHDQYGRPVQVSVEGSAPLGELLGMRSGGDEKNGVPEYVNTIVLDLIAGMRTCQEGAVVLPPHVRLGSVPSEPVFMGTQSLLENLTYGSGKAVQESVIWSLCQQLGLPEYFFSAKGGTQEMGKVSFVLSPAQRQLVCLVRSIICAPDVLLVHDLGHFNQEQSALIGTVLANYVNGVALTRLAKKPKVANDQRGSAMGGVENHGFVDHAPSEAVQSITSSTALQRLDSLESVRSEGAPTSASMPASAPASAVSFSSTPNAADHASVHASPAADVRRANQPTGKLGARANPVWLTDVSKRTVIWQATDEVLRAASVRRILEVSDNGRLKIRRLDPLDGEPATPKHAKPATVDPETPACRQQCTPSSAVRTPTTMLQANPTPSSRATPRGVTLEPLERASSEAATTVSSGAQALPADAEQQIVASTRMPRPTACASTCASPAVRTDVDQ